MFLCPRTTSTALRELDAETNPEGPRHASRGDNHGQKEAHLLFCKTAADISGIVGHTCGVERAGKAYKQVLTSLRQSMDETRAMKAVYVYSNYNLREHRQSAGDAFSAFSSTDPSESGECGEHGQDPVAKYTLRRGNLIFKDVTEDGDGGGEESGDESEEGEEGAGGEEGQTEDGAEGTRRQGVKEVTWAVPDGFHVASEPSELNASLVGSHVYMRWEKYGWQLGKITDIITQATPRLFKKFNFRIIWTDGSKGPARLSVDNYGSGTHARFNSWVILVPAS